MTMKKLIILTGILLLPFMVSAYQIDKEYADMAQQLNKTIQQYTAKTEITPKELLSQVKILIDESRIKQSQTISKGKEKDHSNKYYKSYYCYDVNKLESSLKENQLLDKLQNNKEILNQLSEYIIDHKPHRNDFETLLTIGVSPVEAALKTKGTREQVYELLADPREQIYELLKEITEYFDQIIAPNNEINPNTTESEALKEQYINNFLRTAPIRYIHYNCESSTILGQNYKGEDISYSYTRCHEEERTIPLNSSLEEINDIEMKSKTGNNIWQQMMQSIISEGQISKI